MIRAELRIFLTAIMFYTRIPCPAWVGHEERYISLATRYLPLVGWIVAGCAAVIFWLGSFVFPTEVNVLLSMIAGILVTGAFHEDGFADVCDGFGGGWTKEKILLIMKDSRVGSYGVIGMILILGLKFYTLVALAGSGIYWFMLSLVLAHSLSRMAAVAVLASSVYVRDTDDASKAKPVARKLGPANLWLAALWVVIPAGIMTCFSLWFLLVVVPVALTVILLRRYFIKWIGGYTGDCLGATQQVTEVVIYLSLVAVWRYI